MFSAGYFFYNSLNTVTGDLSFTISVDISCADAIFKKMHVLNDVTSDVMMSTCFPDILQIKT